MPNREKQRVHLWILTIFLQYITHFEAIKPDSHHQLCLCGKSLQIVIMYRLLLMVMNHSIMFFVSFVSILRFHSMSMMWQNNLHAEMLPLRFHTSTKLCNTSKSQPGQLWHMQWNVIIKPVRHLTQDNVPVKFEKYYVATFNMAWIDAIRLFQLWRSSRHSRLPHRRASCPMEQDPLPAGRLPMLARALLENYI